ncbi:methyltransferase [Microbacterium phage Sucha]|nr:methyltransferase [Microbacterium phage Sucha]
MTASQPNWKPRKVRYTQDSKSERHPVDDYPTPYAFVETLIDELGLNADEQVHEPCAGGGWAVHHLRRMGFDPTFEDLINSGVDYLAEDYDPPQTGWVITNPPYKLAEAFAHKALTHARGVALLMNSSFIESVGRAKGLFADFPPSLILVNARKMRLRNGAPSVFAHYWIVWDRDHEGPTELRWVLPEGEIKMPSGMAPGVWEE